MGVEKEKTVNAKKVELTLLNCVQKVSSMKNTRLNLLNTAYREAEHDLKLLEDIGVINKKEVEETLDKMRFHYVEKGLKFMDFTDD